MGPDFRRLVASSWSSNLGDGIAIAAAPLLVASQTDSAFLIAAALGLQRLPWAVLGLYAGAIADRVDRRRLIVAANLARVVVLAVLSAALLGDAVNVAVVLAAVALLGTAETFADVASGTLLPMIVDADDLGVANARLGFGRITLNQLAGPAIGAFLFAASSALPFLTQATTVALAAVVVARMAIPAPVTRPNPTSVRADIVEGARWVWSTPPIRTLTITIIAFNITFGALSGVLVLAARQRLGLADSGFGLLLSTSAVGGVLGTMIYGRLERSLGRTWILRVGLLVETLTQLAFAWSTSVAVVFPVFFVFGIHEAAWGATVATIRQRLVPEHLMGRVGSVYSVGLFGSLVVGSTVGGLIADRWGVTAPMWFGFAGSAGLLLVLWRPLAALVTPGPDRPSAAGTAGPDSSRGHRQ